MRIFCFGDAVKTIRRCGKKEAEMRISRMPH